MQTIFIHTLLKLGCIQFSLLENVTTNMCNICTLGLLQVPCGDYNIFVVLLAHLSLVVKYTATVGDKKSQCSVVIITSILRFHYALRSTLLHIKKICATGIIRVIVIIMYIELRMHNFFVAEQWT